MTPGIVGAKSLPYCLRVLAAALTGVVILSANAQASEWASGVIVKLKAVGMGADGVQVPSSPAYLSFESATRTHMRLTSAALRNRVPFVEHRATAFSAHVLKAGHPIPLAQAQDQAERLRRDPNVEWAIPNVIERPASFAGLGPDPYLPWQTWLHSRDVGLRGVADLPKAWIKLSEQTQPLNPVVVGLLDSGVLAHPDLDGRVLPGYDFVSVVEYARDGDGLDTDATDPGTWLAAPERDRDRSLYGDCTVHDSSWHGLAIAGMLAANTNNGMDGAGILAPLAGSVLLPVRVAGTCGAEVSDIIEGMLWAAGIPYQGSPALNPHPARVVNLSFGGDGSCADTGQQDAAWLYRRTVSALKARGVLVVASAGNGGDNGALTEPTRPANCDGVLAVTALHEEGFKASYANLLNASVFRGLAVAGGDVASGVGPRKGIWTTYNSGTTTPDRFGYGMAELVGTSFSAPTVAGVAALMLAIDPYLSVDELVEGLTSTALPHISRAEGLALGMPDLPDCEPGVAVAQCYCSTATCGAGRLDAEGAINYALEQLRLHPMGTGASSGAADAAFFTPSRLQSNGGAVTHSASGGGALDPSSLAILALMMCLTLIAGGRR